MVPPVVLSEADVELDQSLHEAVDRQVHGDLGMHAGKLLSLDERLVKQLVELVAFVLVLEGVLQEVLPDELSVVAGETGDCFQRSSLAELVLRAWNREEESHCLREDYQLSALVHGVLAVEGLSCVDHF